MKLLYVIILLFLAGCAANPVSWQGTYTATVNGVTGRTKVFVSGPKVRMEFQSPRKTSISIIRYDKDLVWLLAPTIGTYTEISTNDLHMDFPLFFDSRVRIDRTNPRQDILHGRETIKYAAVVSQGNLTFTGHVWEAVPPLPVPIKWEDERGRVAHWDDIAFIPYSPSLFEIPPGLAPLNR